VIALAVGAVLIVGVTAAKPIFDPKTAIVVRRQTLDNIYLPPPNAGCSESNFMSSSLLLKLMATTWLQCLYAILSMG
jgi:hypothetical protein